MFIPRLWTDFYDIDKTHANFDCSKPAPVSAWLGRNQVPFPHDRPLQVAIAQLKSVVIHGTRASLQETTAQLSHPAPLLESLRIEVYGGCSPENGPVIPINLFNGDLSSLRELRLQGIRTELSWRNMVNLTSFALTYTWPGESPVRHLLDFFESAPRLRKIQLHFATPTFGAQAGRLVSLACLKRMDISGSGPPSLLFDHMLVPTNAKLTIQVDPPYSTHIPKSLYTIGKLTGFTIHLHVAEFYPSIRFSGSDGEISIISATPRAITTCRVLESLPLFDLSKVERLRLAGGDLMRGGCAASQALEFMRRLRTLTISRCKNLSGFIRHLNDFSMCPSLEELVLDPRADGENFNIQSVVATAEGRTITGMKLKSIRIVSRDKFVKTCALLLKEYALHVECSPRVALVSDDTDSGDEED